MKCSSCQAPLTLNDECCPYCGTPNPFAKQHRRDMNRFSAEFQRVRASVLNKSSLTAARSIRLVIVCFMLLLVIIAFVMLSSSWEIADFITSRSIEHHIEEHLDTLDTLETEKDFIGLSVYYDYNRLYRSDKAAPYEYIYQASNDYHYIYYGILNLFEEEHWEGQKLTQLTLISDSVCDYYHLLDREENSYYGSRGCFEKVHLDAVEALTDELEAMLKYTFRLSDEEMAQFPALSDAEKRVFLERRFLENE